VLRKIGIAQSEFTNPRQGGRINFYLGDKVPGRAINASTPTQAQLFANGINAYDMTILACQGADGDESANQDALRNYAAAGGRVFATHRSFNWLYKNNANAAVPTDPTADNWSQVATWRNDDASGDYSDATFPVTSFLDFPHNPKANAFQGWLSVVGALNAGTPSSATVFVVRHDTDGISPVAGQTQQWLYRNGIGRCTVNNTAICYQGLECGQAGDTCGQLLTCPTCPPNNACVSGKCVPLSCVPTTCAAQGVHGDLPRTAAATRSPIAARARSGICATTVSACTSTDRSEAARWKRGE